MAFKGTPYHFKAKVWKYNGPNGWIFVSLPMAFSKEIRATYGKEEEGWGRLKATAKIGDSEWKTAIWFDTKQNTYLLPLKAEVRMKESIQEGQDVELTVWI